MTATTPEVTVIVPYLRAEGTIRRAIDSVLAQTLSNVEIIAISDGSTDRSSAIVQSIADRDPRVRRLGHAPNRGPSFARNQALEQSAGTWVAVLDADDAFEPHRLATLVAAATAGAADVVVDDLMGIDPLDGRETGAIYGELPSSLDVMQIVATHATGSSYNFGYLKPVIRRALIDRHALRYVERLRTGEDLLLLTECALLAGPVLAVDRPLYRYTLQVSPTEKRASRSSHSLPMDREMADELAALKHRLGTLLDDRAAAAIDRRIGDLRRDADVSMFRHFLFGRHVGPALSLLARSTEVRRYARDLVTRKVWSR